MGRYAGRIKVVGLDLLCFPVNPVTLEAEGSSCYDPYAWRDPDPEPVETISTTEWDLRVDKKRQQPKPRAQEDD